MRLTKPLLLVAAALCLLTGPAATEAGAAWKYLAPVPVSGIPGPGSWTSFAPSIDSEYNLSDGTPSDTAPDGKITSSVLYNASQGLYAYTYKVTVYAGARPDDISSLSLNWWSGNHFAQDSLGKYAYVLASGGTDAEATVDKIQGSDSGLLTITFDPDELKSTASAGAVSKTVVVFSTEKPIFIPVNSIVDGPTTVTMLPSAYAPNPEPSAMALWAIGGLGLGLGGWWHRRRLLGRRPVLSPDA